MGYRLAGFSRKDDQPPVRLYDVPVSAGEYQDAHLDREMVERELEAYYAYLGWDVETGLPTEGGLIDLGLGSLLEDTL